MPRPGKLILDKDTPPTRSAPLSTDTLFLAGLSDQGPQAPVPLGSMADVAQTLGARQPYSPVVDSLEEFFADGGSRAYFSRALGPAAAPASINLRDSANANTLRFTAKWAGLYGNNISVQVVGGAGTYQLIISQGGVVVETSPVFSDKPTAVAWPSTTGVVADLGGVTLPATAAGAPLAGGTDDRASVGDAQWAAALGLFTADLGPGQVAYPGRTTMQGYTDLLNHAMGRNRFALLDVADTTNPQTLLTAAASLRSLGTPARFGALWGPWGLIPGLLSTNTSREVPFSAVQAALMARSDATNSANVAAAGENGKANYLTGLNVTFDDPTHDQLSIAGVNIAKLIYGGVRSYGYRTLADPVTDANHILVSNARLRMAIYAKCDAALERHMFANIDGQGIEFTKLERDLTGVLLPYFNDGSLYGTKPSEGFRIDVGPNVNTRTTIGANELHAKVTYRPSGLTEFIELTLYKTPITQEV